MASGGLNFRGIDLVRPINRIVAGFCSVAVNVRAYFLGGVTFRNLLTGAIYTLAAAVHSLRRINDSTPAGPPSGYSIINGAGTVLSIWNSTSGVVNVATGLSGNPISIIPFRPNASVRVEGYVGDSAPQGNVTLNTQYLGISPAGPAGTPVNFVSNGMMKVSSTGICWKSGIKEPQLAPTVSTQNSSITVTGTLEATANPWTNYLGANTNYDYGQTDAYNGYPGGLPPFDGTAPFIVDVENATTITITAITGAATINGAVHGPSDSSPAWVVPANPGFPGQFIQVPASEGAPPATASVVIGAFTDGAGNVIPIGVPPLYIASVVDVGAVIGVANAITVPYGAQAFQIGINSEGNTFNSNSGSFTITVTVTTNALPSVTSILGTLNLDYWGDSPKSGPVGEYIWKNPDDPGGSGPERTASTAVGNTSGNSFIFDALFGTSAVPNQPPGIPGPPGVSEVTGGSGIGTAMQWTILNPESVATGSNAVFAAPITVPSPQNTNNTQFANFNFCLTGDLYFPQPGNYTLILTCKDDCIWGIGGGVTLVSGYTTGYVYDYGSQANPPNNPSISPQPTTISNYGQTITVEKSYPLLPRVIGTYAGHGEEGVISVTTVVVNVPSEGIYPIEIDYDYWYHSGRILLLMATPTPSTNPDNIAIIPPLPASVRQQVQYRYCYRSSATGATSNPSPESTAETVPVSANTVTSLWSNDPQVDVVDYYRIDSVTSSFTYVATGPNDGSGGGITNTPISDSLLDTELGDQLLDYDNYEPFPSIDLPQKGICNVSGGVITWVSGGAIGGTAQGFNARWLAGTVILIGSPTSLAYVLIARPTPAAFQTGYNYPLNFIILDPAGHYQLVTVSGTSGGSAPVFNDSGGNTISGGVTFTDQGFTTPSGYVTQITIPGVPDGTDLVYEIPEPILAAQPLAYIWGPTDNVNFAYGVGDPLRPGTLYWCAGSNLDSAPDTNQQDITDPGEPLVNGALTSGLGVVFSIKRAWLILPNFFNALATVTGTEGSTWSLQESSITRGLYIPRCVCVSGGGNVFFRVDDGIHVSARGAASKSITDTDLYPLFPHENEDSAGNQPQPITRQGITIYPPDDTKPQLQKFSWQNGYMYYDYQGTDGNPHTLVFDEAAMGWVYDLYTPAATIHAANEGQSQQGVLVGCSDGTVRQLASNGTETITGTVTTSATGGRGYGYTGMMVCEYSSTSTVTLTGFAVDEGNGSYGPAAITLPSTGGVLTKYFFRPSPNKYKLIVWQFSSTVPFILNFDGFVCYTRSWGASGPYTPIQPFGGSGGAG